MLSILRFVRDRFRRGARTSRNSHAQSVSLFLELPIDMVLLIGSCLPPEDVISLSLCCKCLFAIFPLRKTLSTQQKTNLLERLERGVGHKYSFCSYCIKLHEVDPDPKAQVYQSLFRRECLAGTFSPMFLWTRGERILDYQVARLLANNHQLMAPIDSSPTQFYPDDQISHGVHANTGLSLSLWHVTVQYKFINNHLLLKATHRIQGKDWNEVMQGDKERWRHQLCSHAYAFGWEPPDSRSRRVAGITLACPRSLPPHTAILQTTTACKMCLTDWSIECKIDGDERITVTAQTYHFLGDISSHLDPAWLLFTGHDFRLSPAELKTIWQKHRRGSILGLWEGAAQLHNQGIAS